VPGLYERIFYDTLGMRSTGEVVRLYGETLAAEGLDPAAQRVLDFGAGNGLGGEPLRALGIGELYGIDLEPMARTAAERDRPGVYDDYWVGDLGAWTEQQLEEVRRRDPTAVLALSAIGIGHVPPTVLDRALGLMGPGGIYAFAVAPRLAPGSDDPAGVASGYPDYLRDLRERTEDLGETSYVHRRRPDGSDDLAVAFVGRIR
jgi:predicted TPR repeat methyltransferase